MAGDDDRTRPPGVVKPTAEAQRLALEIARLRGHPLLVWHAPDNRVDWDCVEALSEMLDAAGNLSHVDLLVNSPGGDIHCAYRCVREIRRKAGTVSAIVPFWAKSAATFLALACDEILYGQRGELGPLDAQLRDPAGSADPLSALDEFKSLEAIRTFAVQTLDIMVFHLMSKADMDIRYALDRAQVVITEMSRPLYAQIRPRDLGQFSRQLMVGERYAKEVMKRWSYRDRSDEEIDAIVQELVYLYPDHKYVIDLQEAQRLKLKASALDSEVDSRCYELVNRHKPMFELVLPPVTKSTPLTASPGTTDDVTTKPSNDGPEAVSRRRLGGNGNAKT